MIAIESILMRLIISLQVDLQVTRNNRTLAEMKVDLCDKTKKRSDLILGILALIGVPFECPVTEASKICRNYTTSQYTAKKVLPLLVDEKESSFVKVKIDHGSLQQSCFEVKARFGSIE
jgi:hypothetical protein